MLQKGLELSFRRGLESDDAEVIRQCLRTYAIIDKVKRTELKPSTQSRAHTSARTRARARGGGEGGLFCCIVWWVGSLHVVAA
jgi:hypothetical protein